MRKVEPGTKLKLTKKTIRVHFDNQYKRGLTQWYIDLLSVNLGREYQSMVSSVRETSEGTQLLINNGKNYVLKLYILGLGVIIYWHRHDPKSYEGTEKDL